MKISIPLLCRVLLCTFTFFTIFFVSFADEGPQAPAEAGLLHPRLFFDATDLPEIREKLYREPYATMFESLQANVDRGEFYRFTNPSNSGSLMMRAKGSAFLYTLTGLEEHAVAAREDVLAAFALIGTGWATTSTSGLTLYSRATDLAIIYDLCASSAAWDATLNDDVSQRLVEIATVIVNHGGTGQANDAGSNWQANRGASAALAFLATDHPFDPDLSLAAHNRVVNYLVRNSGGGDSRGWNPEGFGYTAYAVGSFVGPYGVAAARADSSRDLRAQSSMRWKTWTGFAGATTALNVYGTGGVKTDWSNDNAHVGGEGIYGLAFFFSPPDFHGALRHAYDRFMGFLAPHGGNWDGIRHGTFWSILFYPDDVTPQNPLEHWDWHRASNDSDGLGVFTFRDGYEGPGDILAQFKARRYNLGQAHNGPDGLGVRIIGEGTPFVIGGGRNQPHSRRNQSTVYPSNPNLLNTSNNNPGELIGQPLVKPDGGGHVIGRMNTSNVGTSNHKRWFVADFETESTEADAAFLIADTSTNGLFWQIPTFFNNTVTTSGNTFTVTGENGSTLRGTVLYPAGPVTITTGTRARGDGYILSQGGTLDTEDPVTNPRILENRYVFVQGNGDGSFLVALTLQSEPGAVHPNVQHLSGGVGDATVLIGNRQYSLFPEDVWYDGAIYAAPAAVVTFDSGQSGSVVSGNAVQTVNYGAAATAPTVTASEGFEFIGWDRPFDRVVRNFTIRAVYLDLTSAPASFAAWQASAGFSEAELTDPAIAGYTADPTGSGWINAWRWAFGVDRSTPVAAFAPSTRLVREGNSVYFEFSYLRSTSASEANLIPQASINLTDWNHSEPAWAQHRVEPEPGWENVERVTWRLNREPDPAFYVRLGLDLQ